MKKFLEKILNDAANEIEFGLTGVGKLTLPRRKVRAHVCNGGAATRSNMGSVHEPMTDVRPLQQFLGFGNGKTSFPGDLHAKTNDLWKFMVLTSLEKA